MGNLIEQLGGYDEAKRILRMAMIKGDYDGGILAKTLLEYRRKYSIFEEGDCYVYLHDWDCDLDIVCKFTVSDWSDHLWNIINMIRHATDEEIAAGRRL